MQWLYLSNIITALKEIHHGTYRPYPCGAGAGYLGVSASGELAACHRFVEVENQGHPACNYIRDCLHYTLQAYVRTFEYCPVYFSSQ
jgi:hypothetical protein